MYRRPSFLTDPTGRRRLVGWAVAGLLLVALGAGIAGRISRPGPELHAAEDALRRHDPAAARAPLDHYLARWPNDPQALLLAAQAARRTDACADAERFLAAFEQASGPTDASRLEWALLGTQQGDFADEEDRLRSDVARNRPETAAILEALAKGYYVAYRWPDALAVLDQLLERSPDHVPALLLRGTIRDRLRRMDAAEDFRRAVDVAPENAAAHAALAGLLNRTGYTREAIYHYEWAQRLRPADPETLLGLARAFTDAAQLDEAERRLDELLAAQPGHPDGLVERGRLALRRGRAAEAEPFLARAVREAPWHREGHQLQLVVLKELGRPAAAQCGARLAQLREEDAVGGRLKLRARDNPGDTGVRGGLWLWSLRNGQEEEGVAWLTEVLRVAPRHGPAHAAFAEHFERAGQPRRAALHRLAAGPRAGS